jgi:hypothetical protein
MSAAHLTARIRRALKRPPGYLVRRAIDAAERRARRPWSYVYPRLLTERSLLAALRASDVDELWDALSRQPFFVQTAERGPVTARLAARYPGAREDILRAADAVVRHEFDLLGSGPQALGTPLPWHDDFKTGRRWPLTYAADIEYIELDRPSDVKVPWELSRCQHFTRLGQAYWLTGDDRYAAEFAAEVTGWIAANPFAYGVNWACAMDVALRAVNWIWGFHYMADAPACRDRGFRASFLRALFLHGEFIATHLERGDVNGNHYLCDGVGLVFLGGFFRRARRATRWHAIGRAIVEQEIFNQTTPDGVDFEQSTAYHRLVLEAFLTSYELLRRSGDTVPPACWTRLERMCEFVQAYTKPDGRVPLIGDADDGRIQMLGAQALTDHRYLLSSAAVLFRRGDFKTSSGRCWEETFWLLGPDALDRFDALDADPAPLASTAFADGGFYVLRAPDTHLIVDCGEVGMRGRGGHGHNDILSFELFLNGRNLITDCGAYVYTASRDWRNRFRSTAFHNTVQVDDEELNRFVGPDALWQLQYDAVPVGATMTRGGHADVFRGAHRGYERLAAPVSHARECVLDAGGARALVRDRLDGSGAHALVWRFHLDPAVTPHADGTDVRLACDNRVVWLLPDGTAARFTLTFEPGWVSASYGVKVPTTVLVWKTSAPLPIVASFLFAESRLTAAERVRAIHSLG